MIPDIDAPTIDAQISRMLEFGYPELAGQSTEEFLGDVDAMRQRWRANPPDLDGLDLDESAEVVLVAQRVPLEAALSRITLAGRRESGFVDRNHGPDGLAPYTEISQITLPAAPVYALIGPRRGDEFRDMAPKDAVVRILSQGRTPLTMAEGVAWMTQHPEILQPNRCFMLAGSRRGDKRVPALWISQRAPKLGWCWEGNPHSWLGTASTADRF